jgi:hypothetical protein
MRKIMLSVVACCAVIAILPASALAHGHHHKRHHQRAHHARIHHWGSDQGTGQSQAQDAGTVQSFTGGVLTIALNNGQTVSGQVTGDTELKCEAAETPGTMSSHDRRGDNGGDQGDDDQGQGDDKNAMCGSSNLTPGTVVHEAELRVSSAGAVWDRVELVTASSTSTGDNDNDGD